VLGARIWHACQVVRLATFGDVKTLRRCAAQAFGPAFGTMGGLHQVNDELFASPVSIHVEYFAQ
jgi:hypothetical protein